MSDIKFEKILIIQPAFIGDVILATGAIEKLHTSYPQAEIDILIKRENREVFAGHPFLKEIYLFDKSKKLKSYLSSIKKIRKKKYDLVINLHRFFSSGLITALSGGKVKVGFDKNPLSFFYSRKHPHIIDATSAAPVHEIERNHSLIAEYTDAKADKPRLYPLPVDQNVVKIYQKQEYVCIAPTSVWYTKQLPEEKWVDLIKQIPQEYAIHLLGAIPDISICERIKNNSRRNNVKVLAGSLSLLQSAALMKGATLNFVNDSAPMHLASAMNAPVCAVYCSTVPAFGFGPLADFSRIVEIDYPLECKPCNLHGYQHCPKGHLKCAKDIKVGLLMNVFREITGRAAKSA